jgi:hypothetical protein
MRLAPALLLLFLPASACRREPAVILCNNSNCVPPVDVDRDDTMEALRESLVLEWQGRPAFDGMEIDTVWDARDGRCVFAYLYDRADGAFDAREAAQEIADHVRATAASSARTRFYFKVQTKVEVAPDGHVATADEMAAHADCAIDLAEIVEAAAEESGRRLAVLFGEDPAQNDALAHRPRWIAEKQRGLLDRRLVFRLREDPLGDAEIDVVSFPATELRDPEYASLREIQERGLDVQLWSRFLSVETMAAIDLIEPSMYDTNDVLSARLYLGPTPEEDP